MISNDRYQSFDCLCSCNGPCAVIPIWFPELNGHAAYLTPRHSLCNACDSTPSAAHCVPAGHHLYSCPKSVSDDVFPMKKDKIKPVI